VIESAVSIVRVNREAAQRVEYAGARTILRSSRPFDAVCATLQALVGKADLNALNASASKREIEESVARTVGPSGFVIFQILEHGLLLSALGLRYLKARLYVIGNPLIAASMTKEQPAVALYVPLPVFVYEEDGQTVVTYDRPSAMLSQFASKQIAETAVMLDGKLSKLAAEMLGA
jgi:uncharacterized protein (DUF302 family)